MKTINLFGYGPYLIHSPHYSQQALVFLVVHGNVLDLDFGALLDLLDERLAVLWQPVEVFDVSDIFLPTLKGLVDGLKGLQIVNNCWMDPFYLYFFGWLTLLITWLHNLVTLADFDIFHFIESIHACEIK